MTEMQDLQNELASIAITLGDLETTLSTLAHDLGQHPPGDLMPVLAELASLKLLLPTAPHRTPGWPWPVKAAALGLTLWAGSLAWVSWRQPAGDSLALLRDVDQVLVINYKQLSQSMQEKLQAVYSKAGVASPGHRQQK
jgi:hypothetical protein